MSRFTVQNESGQVVSYDLDAGDPRKAILEQRIARGELTKVADGTESAGRPTQVVVVEDEHTGLTDEQGDLLKSIHGGGLDPDAAGDITGQPSGSKSAEELGDGFTAVKAFAGRPTPETVYAAASGGDDEKVDEPEPAEESNTDPVEGDSKGQGSTRGPAKRTPAKA